MMADNEKAPRWMPSSRTRWPWLTWADYDHEEPPVGRVRGMTVKLTPLVGGDRLVGKPNVFGNWDEAKHRLSYGEWLLMSRAVLPGDQAVPMMREPAMGMGWLMWLIFGALAGGALVAVALSGA